MTLIIVMVCAAAIGAAGALITDCSAPGMSFFGDDPAGLCAGAEQFGIQPEPWMGLGLIVVAILAPIAAWAPTQKRRERRADLRSLKALGKNLGRVGDKDQATQDEHAGAHDELAVLVDQLRGRFEKDDTDREELFETWVATSRICNDLLHSGGLELDDFKRLNTELLEIVSAVQPAQQTVASP